MNDINSKPNIIFITSHDIGKHLGCYGVPQAGTPNLDDLATQGVRFDRFYATSPQCSPARASLYTGRYPHSHGVIGICSPVFGFDLNPGEKHLVSFLKDAGYETALIGRQHETAHPERLPFDVFEKRGSCDEVASQTLTYLQENGKGGKPFYLQIGFHEPHRPFHEPPYSEKGIYIPPWLEDEPSARDELALFQGDIHRLDAAIGEIMASLEGHGLAQDTLVIFLADHGIPFPRAKHSLYEPGCEVAALFRWPARGWLGGRVFDEMISGVDLLPTLLESLDLALPTNLQGRDFRALLDGGDYRVNRRIFTEQNFNAYMDVGRAVRTQRHKLIANFTPGRSFFDSSQLWRPNTKVKFIENQARTYHPGLEFYDLESDPLETTNLIDDPDSAKILDEMKRNLYQWMQDTEDPLLEGLPGPPIYRKTLGFLRGN